MRKLYNEFFYIPKHGKIREKVMLNRIVSTITIIVMCLVAMSITAYAYFFYNVTSGFNTIKAASFYTDVTVQITAQDGTAVDTITTNTSDHKSHSTTLEANKTYFITLKHNVRSTAQTGFVIIIAENCETRYHTQQLGKDGNGNIETITFTLTPGKNTVVTFCSHWGTSCFYPEFMEIGENNERYITQGEEIKLTISGVEPGSQSKNNTNTSGKTTTTSTTDTNSSAPTTESSTSKATGTGAPTGKAELSSSATETTLQTTVPATTEITSTESTTETQHTTENSETTGSTITKSSE